MKILIISESSEKLDTYSNFFIKNDFNTITYSWLLKALDNIIEIKPDAVIVNAIDYPRHWKALVQYARAVYEHVNAIILITPAELDEDELKKIEALDVIHVQEDFITTDEANRVLSVLGAGDVTDEDFEVLDFIEDQDRQKHVFLEQSVEDYVKEFNEMLANQSSEDTSETSTNLEEDEVQDNVDIEIPLQNIYDTTQSDEVDYSETVDYSENTEVTTEPDVLASHDDILSEEMSVVEDRAEENISESHDIYTNTISQQSDADDVSIDFEEFTSSEGEAIPEEFTDSMAEQSVEHVEESKYESYTDSIYFEETATEENIFEDDEPINTDYGTWLSCPIPDINEVVFGEVIDYEHPIITFKPSDKTKIPLFTFGKKIETCTLTDDGYPTIITVQVQGFEDNTVELCVVR